MSDATKPSESALAAAYQVTARCFVAENQIIWHRASLYIALNSLILVALNYFGNQLPLSGLWLILGAGALYGVLWNRSMARAWGYHQFYIQISREQEAALGLGSLGPFTRGQVVTDGEKHVVGKEDIRFPSKVLNARALADITNWVFVLTYLVILVRKL